MNRFQNKKVQDLQKPFPGCMGRMINLFDLSAGMAGTKLLTERAHRDGSPVHRNRHDAVKKVIDPVGVQLGDKPITSELRKSFSSKKSGGTPMKMLIAQEMSKEMESKQNPPSVVARLMGLDAMPAQQVVPTANGSLQEGYSGNMLAGTVRGYQHLEDSFSDNPMSCEIHSCTPEKKEYKDVYEVWQQPSRTSCFKDQSLQNGRYKENPNGKRMDLVRQKFMEAKRLATDGKLLQSKEFQDALEVLSSNKDLFLKFLEEPNSLFSKHTHDLQTVPPRPQTKRITILKPSKAVETMGEKKAKKQQYPTGEESGWDMNKPQWSSSFTHPKAGNLSQPTRIVVLKPSPGKSHDMKSMITSPISSPKEMLEEEGVYGSLGTDETRGSREIAKEITRQMRESMSSNRRDEALMSSVLSNGYVGDESSFNRSENYYIEEEGGSLSDSEIVTPTSRHSWDYNNRFGSPCSFSSFSRASYSPESSVIREAKKRLSERLAMVASNGISLEQRQARRSSSTLGEVLGVPEVKKEEGSDGFAVSSSRSCDDEQDLRAPVSCLSISRTKFGCGEENTHGNLLRSKSVPVSSSAYENFGLNVVEVSDSQISKSIIPEATKSKSGKSSFKGKVSSFFFSRNKKPSTEKSIPSPLVGSDNRHESSNAEFVGKRNDDLSECDIRPQRLLVNAEEILSDTASPPISVSYRPKQGAFSDRAVLSLEKPRISENSSENQDQPSPISILEAPFEDDPNNTPSQSSESANAGNPQALSRSPPIESVARSLSWDVTHLDAALPNPLKLPRVLSKADEEEQERFAFVQTLLSSTGIDNEKSNAVFTNWHSPESPLDPLLLETFLDRKGEEAQSRERRSNQRLLFDCVNATLLDIGRTATLRAYPCAGACSGAFKNAPVDAPVTTKVWELIREWFSGEQWVSGQTDNSSLVVDREVRKEVVKREWAEMMGLEIDEISKEIGGEVLEELVGEALADLTGGL